MCTHNNESDSYSYQQDAYNFDKLREYAATHETIFTPNDITWFETWEPQVFPALEHEFKLIEKQLNYYCNWQKFSTYDDYLSYCKYCDLGDTDYPDDSSVFVDGELSGIFFFSLG